MLIVALTLNAFNDRDVLFKQANRYYSQRQYQKAIELYEKILQDHPDDQPSIEKLINIFIRNSSIKKAEKLLKEKKNVLSELLYIKLELSILLNEGEIKKAGKLANNFINRNRSRINNYRMLANVFEQFRQFEFAIDILLKARKISNDKYLYARELAFDYQNMNDMKNAVTEYLNYLENNKNYSNYVLNKFREILKDEPEIINTISEVANSSDKDYIKEIYALCLGEVGDYEKALEVYRELIPIALLRFARRQESFGNLDIAKQAFQILTKKITDPAKKADAKIDLAKIYIEQGFLTDAHLLLIEIKDNERIKGKKYKYKTQASTTCRELLAEIELRENGPSEKVIEILESAKKYAVNALKSKQIDFKIIYLHIINEQYAESKKKLQRILKDQNPGSVIYKESYYYSYLSSLFQDSFEQDSLLTEIIINIPQDDRTNDILFLANFLGNLQSEKTEFLKAYRKKLIYQEKNAIDVLQNIYQESNNEEILMLAGEWAVQAKEDSLAKQIFSTEFEDEILREYSELMLAKIEQNKQLSRDFLKNNPQSVFSPEFRKILEKQ